MLIRRKLLVAAVASGLTASLFLVAQPASAQEAPVIVYGAPIQANTVRVHFADLNLRRVHDQVRLHHRVGGAIERVCDLDLGRDGLQDHGYYACTYHAWGMAAPQIIRAWDRAMAGGSSWSAAAIVISGR